MAYERFIIKIDGREAEDLYPDLVSLEVELDDELAGMFRLEIAILLQANGEWTYLDDERFMVWQKVSIEAGFESGTEAVMSGYITHVRPAFEPDPTACRLEIWGMDGSVLMDRAEKLKDWPNKKDSDIAAEIFRSYGFRPVVDNTTVVHDEAVSTVIQRETDMQFLKRLALRNGFDCFVDGQKGYFRRPALNAKPQAVLAAHFGEQTNLNRFSVEVNGLSPTRVTMFQVGRVSKEVLEVATTASRQNALGQRRPNNLLARGMKPGQIYVNGNTTTGNPEMTALTEGLFHRAEWFVTGEGEIAGNAYEHVLKPRGTVTIKGVGETHSGLYYVNHVTHTFNPDGYIQSFQVKRNGLNPTGLERF